MKKVVFATQERIDDFECTAVEVLLAVLGMDYGECIVTEMPLIAEAGSSPDRGCNCSQGAQLVQGMGRGVGYEPTCRHVASLDLHAPPLS
jgi:hypothetical protein